MTESQPLWALTEVETEEEFSFIWSIKNYAAVSRKGDTDKLKELESPVFKCPKSKHEWRLKLFKNTVDGVDYLAVYLTLSGLGSEKRNSKGQAAGVTVRFQICICDPKGLPVKPPASLTTPAHKFEKPGDDWGWDKFRKIADIADLAKGLVVNDTLTLKCLGWIEGDLRHRIAQAGRFAGSDEITTRRNLELVADIRAARFDEKLADFALSTQKKTFMAHKIILSARSSVFRAMLESSMLESASNTLEILDFDEDVVKAMLDYIYSGVNDDLGDKTTDLLQIADKYDLVGLKENCEKTIASNLTVANAADVLLLADANNAVELKKEAVHFISRNKDAVKDTESFKRIMRSNPFADLFFSM